MKNLFENLKSNRLFFSLTLAVGVAFCCVSVVSPSVSGEMVTAFTAGSESALGLLAVFLTASLAQAVLSQLDMYMTGKLELRLKKTMRGRAFAGFYRRKSAGREEAASFASFINNDIPTLAQQYFVGAIDIVKCGSLLAMSAASLLRIHWVMALAILGVSVLVMAVPKSMGRRDGEARKEYSARMAGYNTLLNSLLEGFRVARAYGYGQRAGELLEAENQRAAKSETRLLRRKLGVYSATACLQVSKTVLIFLLGLWLIGRGELNVGGMIAVIQLDALISSPIEVLAYLFHARNEALPLLKSYQSHLSTPEEKVGQPCGPFQKLELEKISLEAGGLPILRDVSAVFEAGKKYLVSGESGCGKSALLALISQTAGWEYGGRISCNAKDIRSLDQKAYRREVCHVFQEPYLFHATLEENILLGRDISREEYLRIIAKLNLQYLLDRYRNQEVTPEVMERLSGGERQRVALARALAGKAGLYLLDEVTSALDRENSRLIETLLLDEDAAIVHVCHKADPELALRYDASFHLEAGVLRRLSA